MGDEKRESRVSIRTIQERYRHLIHEAEFEEMTAVLIMPKRAGIIYVKSNVNYLGIGPNTKGSLGIGDTKHVIGSAKPIQLVDSCQKMISTGTTTIFLGQNGKVLSFGDSSRGETGTGVTEIVVSPSVVSGPLCNLQVIDICCGADFVLALARKGQENQVYEWGNLRHKKSSLVPINIPILNDKKVNKIASSEHHSLALTEDNKLYSWGYNNCGQLGLGSANSNCYDPQLITQLSKEFKNSSSTEEEKIDRIVGIACGQRASYFYTEKNRIYSCGSNSSGELGSLDFKGETYKFHVLKFPEKELSTIPITNLIASPFEPIVCCSFQNGEIYGWGNLGTLVGIQHEPILLNCRSVHEAFIQYCDNPYTLQLVPVYYPNESNDNLTNHMMSVFESRADSDFEFVVEGQSIKVHRILLCSKSDKMRKNFQEIWNGQARAEIEKTSFIGFTSYIKYLYTNSIEEDAKVAIEVCAVAKQFEDVKLYSLCVSKIKRGINIANAASILGKAVKSNSEEKEIKMACFDFFLKNMTKFVLSPGFADIPDHVLREMFLYAANKQRLPT